jgi:hypothetical protein
MLFATKMFNFFLNKNVQMSKEEIKNVVQGISIVSYPVQFQLRALTFGLKLLSQTIKKTDVNKIQMSIQQSIQVVGPIMKPTLVVLFHSHLSSLMMQKIVSILYQITKEQYSKKKTIAVQNINLTIDHSLLKALLEQMNPDHSLIQLQDRDYQYRIINQLNLLLFKGISTCKVEMEFLIKMLVLRCFSNQTLLSIYSFNNKWEPQMLV